MGRQRSSGVVLSFEWARRRTRHARLASYVGFVQVALASAAAGLVVRAAS